jgi:alcohol dehydrogenase
LAVAKQLGADVTLKATDSLNVSETIRDLTHGGADASLDALGSVATLSNSVLCLRKRGRHVQVGLLNEGEPIPPAAMQRLIAWELEIAGSHGIQARVYPEIFDLIQAGKLDPTKLVERTLPLNEAPRELESLHEYRGSGVTVFTPPT